MNVSVRGLLSTRVRAAVDRYLDLHMSGNADKEQMLATVERARERFATLINSEPDEVSVTKNASEGLNIVAASLPWRQGDNVIICPELEHPNNVYPWLNLKRRQGVELKTVTPRDGHIPIEEMIAAIDERTRVVTASTVTFSPGFLTDVRSLADACRDRDVLTVVDAAQSVGVIQTDVRDLGVDALAAATQKGLLAFYGMGFFYCRRAVAESLTPAYLARFGVALGKDAHETAMDREVLELASGARRFDLGNYNYLGATAADASLAFLLEVGVGGIEKHVRTLSQRFAEGIEDLGLPVCGGTPGPHLGHIIAVGRSGGGRHYTADDPAMNSLYQHLTSNDVTLSIRRGVLRFSLHVYNNEEDVDRVLALTREWRSSNPAPRT
jgi:cysteine desulfurase/selenocysteine lyase